MMKVCGQNTKICAICLHLDGYRLGHVVHDKGSFFKYNNIQKAKCMHPKDFAHFEKHRIKYVQDLKKDFKYIK